MELAWGRLVAVDTRSRDKGGLGEEKETGQRASFVPALSMIRWSGGFGGMRSYVNGTGFSDGYHFLVSSQRMLVLTDM